jgi:(p)ppGpp synthase/HD superfamily hydrolase
MDTAFWGYDPFIERAAQLAVRAHEGQLRKYVGGPYVRHPMAVARLVRRFTHDRAMLAAALLHDVAEDTAVALAEIEENFGKDVSSLVSDLTDVSRPGDGNREQRKAIDRAHTAGASPRAKTIKACDLVHNTASIVRHDPTFARVYLAEKALLLEVLQDASDPGAVLLARRVHERGLRALVSR